MRVVLTGAGGFLGWHTRVRLRALTTHEVVAITRADWNDLGRQMVGADAVMHMAGVNRAAPDEVRGGNAELAADVARAVRASGGRPRIVYANSIHAGTETPYGEGKQAAEQLLNAVAREVGSTFVDVRLPNVFGEHGRPHYNSFVATFVDAVLRGESPEIHDRPVDLLHVQAAAEALIGALTTGAERLTPPGTPTTVMQVYDKLRTFRALYAAGDIPPLLSDFDLDVFNTLRAARFPHDYPLGLQPRTDHRGSLVEAVRAHGGSGQTFVSTTRPGVTRGEHFHLRKMERFVVIGGRARIRLRRLFADAVVSFDVCGDEPTLIDMPTMWAHNITNTGEGDVTTLFWTHEVFDPAHPDTFPERVDQQLCVDPPVTYPSAVSTVLADLAR